MTDEVCSIPDCGGPRASLGFCPKHYSRFYRHGDPLYLGRAESTPGMTPGMKKAYVHEYLLSHGCADCGYNKHPAALDFDHLPGTVKVRDIKSGQQLGWVALLEEIAKCEVVCANCHRIRTSERRREVMSVSISQSLSENGR